MKQIDLTSSKLFKNLIEFDDDETYIDIHNDYFCYQIKYDEDLESIQMLFNSVDSSAIFEKVDIELSGIQIIKMSLLLRSELKKKITLDTFYRGRYEIEGVLKEYSDQGKPYFYIEFDEGYSMELFANSVKAFLYTVK